MIWWFWMKLRIWKFLRIPDKWSDIWFLRFVRFVRYCLKYFLMMIWWFWRLICPKEMMRPQEKNQNHFWWSIYVSDQKNLIYPQKSSPVSWEKTMCSLWMKMKSEQTSPISIWSHADSDHLSRLWWYRKHIFQRWEKIG